MKEKTFELKLFETSTAPSENFFQIFRNQRGTEFYSIVGEKLHNFHFGIEESSENLDKNAKLLFTSSLNDHQDLLIVRALGGLFMYLHENRTFKNVCRIKYFRDFRGWNEVGNEIYIGHLNENLSMPTIGLMTTHAREGIHFYKMNPEKMFDCKNAIEELQMNIDDINRFSPNRSRIFLAHLRNQQREMIVTRNADGLNIFQLNITMNAIEHVMKVGHSGYESQPSASDRFFFPSLNYENNWNEIALFNSSGLFLYQYTENPMRSYEFVHYNPKFSKALGWREKHTKTIQFEDVDGDGSDDMIFTGPAGIEILSYDYDDQKWKSLIDITRMTPQQRHYSIMHVVPQDEDTIVNPIIVLHDSGHIYWSHLIEIPSKPVNLIQSNEKFVGKLKNNSVVPTINTQVPRKKSILYLRDQVDISTLLNTVSPETGRPKFSLPLVGDSMSIVKLHLSYDGSKTDNGATLGIGWSIPDNFIFLDFQKSIFEEDETFYWVSNNIPYKLKLVAITSESRIYSVDLSKDSAKEKTIKCEIKFYHHQNNWQINFETKGIARKLYFGKNDRNYGAIAYDLTWKNWRDIGSDQSDQMQRAYSWYLYALEEEDGTINNFEYETIEAQDNDQVYTKEIHLKSIHDEHNILTLFYGNKNTNEYKQIPYKDEEGNFNRMLTESRYISGYTFESESTIQSVIFKYDLINESRLLTEIMQISDNIQSSIFKFKYGKLTNTNYVMIGMILPSTTEISFDYTLQELKNTGLVERGRITVTDDYKVNFGSDFILVSYLDDTWKLIVLRLFNHKMTQELYAPEAIHSNTKYHWPLLGDRGDILESYEIISTDNIIVISVRYSGKTSYYMVGRLANSQWKETFIQQDYSVNSLIYNGPNYILILDGSSKLDLFEWEKYEKDWKYTKIDVNSITSVSLYQNHFAVYNNQHIYFGYKDKISKKWNVKLIKSIPNFVEITKQTLKKFDLESDFHNPIFTALAKSALQMSHNLLILNSFQFDEQNQKLIMRIKAFTIGRDHNIADTSDLVIPFDSLSTLSHEELINNNKLILKYEYIDGKFKIQLKSLTGPNEDQEKEFAKEIDKHLNSPAKRFFLPIQNYFVTLNRKEIMCYNLKYTFGGVKWTKSTIKKDNGTASISLGDHMKILKSNIGSNVKLVLNDEKERTLFDFNVRNLKDIQFNYPIYMASQPSGRSVIVAEIFDDKELRINSKTLPISEDLSQYGNPRWLITYEKLQSSKKKILIFRPQYGVERFSPNAVVIRKNIKIPGKSGGSKERPIGYSYESRSADVSGNSIFYNNIQIRPGNNATLYGYIELTPDGRKFYNGNRQLVKQLQQEQDESNEKSETTKEIAFRRNTTLYDKSNQLEIASMKPYSLISEMVGYIGFEDYENNKIGKNKSWSFDQTKIVKKGFSLTGNNYLQLNNRNLKGIFIPEYQNQVMLASCWIRTDINHLPKLGAIVPFLRASALTVDGSFFIVSWMSVVKMQIDDWSYLEVTVDLVFARNLYESKKKKKIDRLQIAIEIEPTSKIPIDVDNVRFSPLLNIFDINVYDTKINRKIATIKTSGSIERNLFDKYGMAIAEINDSNQIEIFRTYTKVSYLIENHHLRNPQCEIELRPQKGFYENFSPLAFYQRWEIAESSETSWSISPGALQHQTTKSDELSLKTVGIDSNAYAIRFLYHLNGNYNANLKLLGGAIEVARTGDRAEIKVKNTNETNQRIPIVGELLLIKESDRIIVWIDGSLYIDQFVQIINPFKFIFQGEIEISNVLILTNMQTKVTYKNALNENIQEISLSSTNTAIIKSHLYDELGRQRIITQPIEVKRNPFESLMSYDDGFVTNDNPASPDSVWLSRMLKGTINELLGHYYGYKEIVYDNDPLNNKICIGLPGEQFSVIGPFARRFSTSSSNLFINNYWPKSDNYSHHVTFKSSTVRSISVFNMKNKKVATLIDVPDGQNRLTTHEYNENGLITQSLPPMYYERISIYYKTFLNLSQINDENIQLQKLLETKFDYDANGHLISKRSPDEALVENIYDSNELLRFIIYYSKENSNEIELITYLKYDHINRLTSTGSLKEILPKAKLLNLMDNITSENGNEFQYFYHDDLQKYPTLRNKVIRAITITNDEPFIEESFLDGKDRTVSKRFIVPKKGEGLPIVYAIKKYYEGNFLKEITYPAVVNDETFTVSYEYDKLGRIISVGIPQQKGCFMNATYNAYNLVANEMRSPYSSNAFTREYKYNEPGFLIQIDDQYLREDISYTEKAYGNQKYGDGTITYTRFTAKWHDKANRDVFALRSLKLQNQMITNEDLEMCLNAFKDANYMNNKYQQTRIIYPDLAIDLPFNCANGKQGRLMAQLLGTYGFPEIYGFSFDYGSNMELTKAKYFVGISEQEPKPLQPDTFFNEIRSINLNDSYSIWQRLVNAEYIYPDDPKLNMIWAHGKSARKSYFNQKLLNDLNSRHLRNIPDLIIRRLLMNYFAQRKLMNLSLTEFQRSSSQMLGDAKSNEFNQITTEIYNILQSKGYLKNPLDDEFVNILNDFTDQINDIVRVLQNYLARQLGKTEFDVESYEIDSNGNHKMFYAGFEHFEIDYNENTNQVKQVKIENFAKIQSKTTYRFVHDSRGNVIQALHKGIELMEYHPVSNCLIKVKLTNGKSIAFHYDSKGERVLKRVWNSRMERTLEVHYLRDELGRTLVERKLTFVSPRQSSHILVTIYIYGPNSLIGFIRENQFYNVLTDHQGSVRVIECNGEVVAAYDYMPYGQLMRIFGNNPNAHISYRYTGQEWDEEIGLYNYHARFYDPSIGRFYQIDPKSQYFSPYKYAGNSPISMIDPTGEFANFLINLAVGLVGAYIEGAAANNSWNPFKWNWKSPNTYAGLALGFISGATLRPGFSASVKALQALNVGAKAARVIVTTVGTVSAAMNVDWKNITSPSSIGGAFNGFSTGVGIISGQNQAKKFWSKLGGKGKIFFGTSGVAAAAASISMAGAATNWDITNPKFIYAALTGVFSAMDLPMMLKGSKNFATKYWKNTIGQKMKYSGNIPKRIQIQKQQEINKHLIKGGLNIGLGILSTVIVGLLTENPADWDLENPSTYYKILSTIQSGGQLLSMGKTSLQHINFGKVKDKIKKAEKISKDVVDTVIDNYESLLQRGSTSKKNDKNHGREETVPLLDLEPGSSRDHINQNNKNNGEIPSNIGIKNTVVGVTITKKNIFVGFSSNNHDGALILFKHNKYSDPISIDVKYLPSNSKIGDEQIKIREFQRDADKIQSEIDKFQNHLKMVNVEEFQNNVRPKLQESMNAMGERNQPIIQKSLDNMIEKIREKGWVEKKFIETEFKKLPPLENVEYMEHSDNIEKLKIDLIRFKEMKDGQKAQITSRRIKKEEALLKESIKKSQSQVVEFVWDKVKDFDQSLTQWDPINCAEMHCISAMERADLVFPDKFSKPLDTSDIAFMGAYYVKTRDSATRCDHCVITTKEVENVITDDDWNEKIEERMKKMNEKIESQTQRFFLKPIHNKYYISELLKKRNETSVKEQGMALGRRRRYINDRSGTNDFGSFDENEEFVEKSNILEFGDNFLKRFNMNDTLFLLNVLFAKFTNRKLPGVNEKKAATIEKNAFTMKILELYEKSIEIAAKMSGIAINRLNPTDLLAFEKIVRNKINGNEFDDLPEVMLQNALKTLPSTEKGIPGRLSINKAETFKNKFHNLNLGKTISDMLIQANEFNSSSDMNVERSGDRQQVQAISDEFPRKFISSKLERRLIN